MICGSNYLFDCNYNFFNRQRTCIFYSYGFVHFEKESDKDSFFDYVKNKSLIGPNNVKYIFREAKTKDDVIFIK